MEQLGLLGSLMLKGAIHTIKNQKDANHCFIIFLLLWFKDCAIL